MNRRAARRVCLDTRCPNRRHRRPRRDDMKLAVIMAMALATLATAVDTASAAARKGAFHRQQAGKSMAAQSLAPKKALKATQPTTKGIIMRDGGICDPIRWGC